MFVYIAYGKTLRIRTHTIFSGQVGLRCEYLAKEPDTWEYVSEPDFYIEDLTDGATTDKIIQECLDKINAATETKFGKDEAPSSGLERVEWMVDNSFSVVDNKVVFK